MVVMAFSNGVCREYVLPADKAVEQPLRFDKRLFGLTHSIEIRFEQNGDLFFAVCGEDAYFTVEKGKMHSAVLSDGLRMQLSNAAGESVYLVFSLSDAVFRVSDKYILDPSRTIRIGSHSDNDIVFRCDDLVEARHAELYCKDRGWYIAEKGKNGIYLNGRRVRGGRQLHFGDEVYIYGLRLTYFGSLLCVSNAVGVCSVMSTVRPYSVASNRFAKTANAKAPGYYNRPARVLPVICEGETEIDGPPALPENKNKSILGAIARPLTMSLPMLVGFGMMAVGMSGRENFMGLGIIIAVSSAVMGAVWALISLQKQSDEENERERKRFNAYGNYLIGISRDLALQYQSNYYSLCSMYPSAETCASYDERGAVLWNRNASHKDFLFARLGLGSEPFSVEVRIPKKNFSVQPDQLLACPQLIKDEYSHIKNVPVGVDLLKQQLIGVIGKNDFMQAIRIAHLVIAQIAANVCYTDVKIVLLNKKSAESDQVYWEYLKTLPHCWSSDQKTRYYSASQTDVEDISYELLKILRMRSEGDGKELPKPYYIVIATDASIFDRNLLSNYLLRPQPEYGMTTLILSRSIQRLPNTCRYIIESDGTYAYIDDAMNVSQQHTVALLDNISVSQLDAMSHRLANIRVDEKISEQSVPAGVDFLSMYGVRSVEELRIAEHWSAAKVSESLRVPIGVKAGGELCCLDIHEKFHGPHGLVAGTTGSGKSETLQTYILSLCVNFSPEDVNFLIIDYKGGGMANLFSGLPHLAGQITNLSGNTIRRAMISIKSESVRRQRLFSDYSVNNINQYTRLYREGRTKTVIPHLVIIVDEFAELKKAEGDFMHELISIAQVGRSLGIHLILATQKPSGTVDDNIRSNSKFRLCLRVQDKQDSIDMLHHADAAYITQPGGGIFQVGSDEIYEHFQSAWSGAVYRGAAEQTERLSVMLGDTGRSVTPGNSIKIRQMEERKLRWFTQVVGTMREVAQGAEIAALSGQNLLQFCDDACRALRNGSLQYRADQTQLKNAARLWPENAGEMSDAAVAAHILEQAAAHGVKLPSMEEQTQLDALVKAIAETSRAHGYESAMQLWLPKLPEQLTVSGLEGWQPADYTLPGWEERHRAWSLSTVVGLIDDPQNQARMPLYFDLYHGGNHAVIGSVASGKSTLIQTVLYGLLRSYPPTWLQTYIIDYSSRMLSVFDGAPGVGGVVFEDTPDRLQKLFYLLSDTVAQRKKLLMGGTYSEYIKQHPGELPAILLVIDNYGGFKEKTDGAYENQLFRLSREGIGYGIYLLVSGAGFSMAEISGRMSENFRTVLTLELADKFKYIDALHTTQISILPENGVRGRGLVRVGDRCMEFQTALMNGERDDYSRGKAAEAEFEQISAAWAGPTARRIPEIPEKPVFSAFRQEAAYAELLAGGRLPVGYAADTAAYFGIDLQSFYCYTVLSRTDAAKNAVLQTAAQAAAELEGSTVTFVNAKNSLQPVRFASPGIRTVSGPMELFRFFKELTPVFVERNKQKHLLAEQGMDRGEIYCEMRSFPPVFVFIEDLASFFADIYSPGEGIAPMNGFLENVLEKGALHNIYFFGGLTASQIGSANMYAAFRLFTGDNAGMLLEMPVSAQKVLDFGNISYSDSNKTPARGSGLAVAPTESGAAAVTVVLPNPNR